MFAYPLTRIAAMLTLALFPISGPAQAQSAPAAEAPPLPNAATERAIAEILARHRIVTAGFGLIRDGRLAWEHYAGEQAPGMPASARTRFNVASITKTVTAETILRLADRGLLSLDEPMAPYWTDPDIADDPRRLALTPRMALNHSTGFPNWRFFLRGGRLAFQHTPGERYTYSGEGMEYLARFAERRLGRPFPELVAETVFRPLGMAHSSIVVRRGETGEIARPVDADGRFHGYFCRPEGASWCRAEGSFSAADDMVTTISDYAAFLRAVADADGYGAAIAADRDRVQTDKGDQAIIDCSAPAPRPCPDAQGYGLGFNLLRSGGETVLGHDGADWSELAIAYLSRPSRAGVIIFLNAPNRRAMAAMPELLALLDPASPFLQQYRRWLAEAEARETAAR